MLVDITRRPLALLPDECPASIVLRTLSVRGVSGTVYHDRVVQNGNYRTSPRKEKDELPPIVRFDRAFATYLETRLPLRETKSIFPLASVFEAASVLASSLDKSDVVAWRVKVSVLYKVETSLWHVTMWDEAQGTPIVLLSMKSLDSDMKVLGFNTPLARMKKALGADAPANCWARLLEDD